MIDYTCLLLCLYNIADNVSINVVIVYLCVTNNYITSTTTIYYYYYYYYYCSP